MPLSLGHVTQSHERKRHVGVAIDATHQESVLIGAEEKVRPVLGRSEHTFAARRSLRHAASEQHLFATPLNEKPAANRARLYPIKLVGKIGFRELYRRVKRQPSLRAIVFVSGTGEAYGLRFREVQEQRRVGQIDLRAGATEGQRTDEDQPRNHLYARTEHAGTLPNNAG